MPTDGTGYIHDPRSWEERERDAMKARRRERRRRRRAAKGSERSHV